MFYYGKFNSEVITDVQNVQTFYGRMLEAPPLIPRTYTFLVLQRVYIEVDYIFKILHL